MRRVFAFAALSVILIGSAIGIGCAQNDAPTAPAPTDLERAGVNIDGGPSVPTELPTQCSATPLARLADNEVMVVDLVYGLSNAIDKRPDDQRAELEGVSQALRVAARALTTEHADAATSSLREALEQFRSIAERGSESVSSEWAKTVVARLEFLIDRPADDLVKGYVSYEDFNRVAREVGGDALLRGGCFQDCLKKELDECADKLIDNIGGPSAGGIIENLIDDCIAGALGGCIATAWSGPGCLIGALEGCLLGISADYIWQVSKFLCCVAGSFASCAWDCLW